MNVSKADVLCEKCYTSFLYYLLVFFNRGFVTLNLFSLLSLMRAEQCTSTCSVVTEPMTFRAALTVSWPPVHSGIRISTLTGSLRLLSLPWLRCGIHPVCRLRPSQCPLSWSYPRWGKTWMCLCRSLATPDTLCCSRGRICTSWWCLWER